MDALLGRRRLQRLPQPLLHLHRIANLQPPAGDVDSLASYLSRCRAAEQSERRMRKVELRQHHMDNQDTRRTARTQFTEFCIL